MSMETLRLKSTEKNVKGTPETTERSAFELESFSLRHVQTHRKLNFHRKDGKNYLFKIF